MREGAPQSLVVFVGRGNDRSWQKVRYLAEGGGSRARQFRRRGRLEALARPLRALSSGQGRSPTQARGQAGTCRAGSGRAWQDAAPERLGGAGPGGRGGPGGGGQGWSGLAVQGPRRALGPGRYPYSPGSWLGAPGQRWLHPFLCPYMGIRERLRGSLCPPACKRTLACCHGDQAPLPSAPPLLGQWNRPRTASLRDRLRAPRAEPLLDWGTITRGLCGWACSAHSGLPGVALPGSSSEAQKPAGLRAGRAVRYDPSDGGRAGLLPPRAVATLPAAELFPGLFLRKKWGWATAPRPSGWVQAPGADMVSVKPRVTRERLWNGDRVYGDLSLEVTYKRRCQS